MCPDEDGTVVYTKHLQTTREATKADATPASVEIMIVYTQHFFFHLWARASSSDEWIRVADIFTCFADDGWTKPNVDVLRPGLETMQLGLASFPIDGVPPPSGPMNVSTLRESPELLDYFNNTYGENFDKPHAPSRLHQVGGVVDHDPDEWVAINDMFGSYDNFLTNLSRTPAFVDAVKDFYHRKEDERSLFTCSDKRSLLQRELHKLGTNDVLADLLIDHRGVEMRVGPHPIHERGNRYSESEGAHGDSDSDSEGTPLLADLKESSEYDSGSNNVFYASTYCWIAPR